MATIDQLRSSSTERSFAGALVTLVNIDTGETRLEHAAGYKYETGSRVTYNAKQHTLGVYDALERLCREADSWPGTWRVRTISTPQTIYADIKHVRRAPGEPERQYLAKIGRLDMLEYFS